MLSRAPRLLGAFVALAAAAAASACTVDTQGQADGVLIEGGAATGGNGGSGGTSDGGAGTGGTSGSGGASGSVGTGGSGGASGGAGGVSGSSGTGGGGPEQCLDGQDNDNNGATDCSDPACVAGYQCVPTAPTGWTGFFRLRGQTNEANAAPGPTCPDGSAPQRFFDSPAPAGCSACTCGAFAGASCTMPTVQCTTSNKSCTGASDWTSTWSDFGCHKNGNPGQLSCVVQAGTVAATGSCPPSTSTFSNPMFSGLTDVCGTAIPGGGGCSTGQACVPRGTGDYAGYVCVRKSGENTCPTDWSTRVVTYTSGTDSRACSACTCTPSTVCQGGTMTFWDTDNCTTCDILCDGSISGATGSCIDPSKLLDTNTWSGKLSPSTPIGSCMPGGGQPTGSVQTVGATTYCCR